MNIRNLVGGCQLIEADIDEIDDQTLRQDQDRKTLPPIRSISARNPHTPGAYREPARAVLTLGKGQVEICLWDKDGNHDRVIMPSGQPCDVHQLTIESGVWHTISITDGTTATLIEFNNHQDLNKETFSTNFFQSREANDRFQNTR